MVGLVILNNHEVIRPRSEHGKVTNGRNTLSAAVCGREGCGGSLGVRSRWAKSGAPRHSRVQHEQNDKGHPGRASNQPTCRRWETVQHVVPAAASTQNQEVSLALQSGRMVRRARRRDRWVCWRDGLRRAALTWKPAVDRLRYTASGLCGSALEDGVVPTEVRERNAADGAQVLSTVEPGCLPAPPISLGLTVENDPVARDSSDLGRQSPLPTRRIRYVYVWDRAETSRPATGGCTAPRPTQAVRPERLEALPGATEAT